MKHRLLVTAASVLVLASGVLNFQSAQGSVIIGAYSGVVTNVVLFNGASDTLGFSIDQPITGSFTFDNSAVDILPESTSAMYQYSISNFRFGNVFSTPEQIGYSSFFIDAEPLHDHVAAYLNALTPELSDVYEFSLEEGSMAAVLGDDQVDLTTLALSDFDLANSRFSLQRNWRALPVNTTVRIEARFTDLRFTSGSAAHVPEPASIAMWGLGALGLVFAARKRRRMILAA